MSDDKFDPIKGLSNLGQTIGRAVEQGLQSVQSVASGINALKLDVYEVDGVIIIRTSAIDGIVPDSIDVNIEEGVLTISAETRPEPTPSNASYILQERRFGAISRAITLEIPVLADKAKAKLKDGVITVTLPVGKEAREGEEQD